MPDQHSNTDDESQVEMGPSYWEHFCDDLKNIEWGEGPHLISVHELRAAGALDVPPAWRKSLGGGPHRQLDLFDDEDTAAMEQTASDDDDAE